MTEDNTQVCKCGCATTTEPLGSTDNSSDNTDYSELDVFIEEKKEEQGNLIIILQKAQALYGYLSRETVAHISTLTNYTQAKIYGVATFYAQFRLAPIGKNLIMLCQGTACHVNGSAEIEKAIEEELKIKDGETDSDGLFTLNNVACLGCCSLAPVMMIQNDEGEETFGNLTKENVVEILRKIKDESSQTAAADI